MPTIEETFKPQEVKSPQSTERAEIANKVYSLFCKARDLRDSTQPLFRDRTPKQYWEDCVKRFIQFKRRPDHKKLWQSNLASSTPNEKLIGILSKLAMQGMEAKVVSQKEVSRREISKERVSNALLKSAGIKNDDSFQIILEMLEALEKGTVMGFEDWYHGKRQIREILDQNPETGELTFKVKTIKEWNDVRGSLVQLEDFYPETTLVRPGCIQDLDSCFLRSVLSKDEFDMEFGKYKDADKVISRSSLTDQSTPFWQQSLDVSDNQIELIRYFNKKTDEYVLVANGIWINPIGKAVVSPLPWNHKRLPFWAGVFEPLDANYFYGRALIDKLISFCDSKDALFDRILDQATIAVSSPVITDGNAASAMTRGFLQPNNVITVDWSNGRPNFDVVPIKEPSTAVIQLYQILQQNLEQSSVSAEVIGGNNSKQKTATEMNIQREGAMELVSLFLVLMEHAIKEKNRLRYANILQFYSLPSNAKDGQTKFKKVILRNEQLGNGKVGTLQIEINSEPNQQRVVEQDQGVLGNTEFVEITPSFLRDMESDIEIVPQSSVKMTEQQRQVLELNYQKVMTGLYPDMFNRDYGFEELNLKFGKDPMKAKLQKPVQETGMETLGMGEMEKPEDAMKQVGKLNLQV